MIIQFFFWKWLYAVYPPITATTPLTVVPQSASGESVTELVTSVYLETSNSSTYVQDAFQLLLPVLQLAIVKSNPLCKDLLLDK